MKATAIASIIETLRQIEEDESSARGRIVGTPEPLPRSLMGLEIRLTTCHLDLITRYP